MRNEKMTTKATFKCENCKQEKEFSICTICHGAIDFPHNQNPLCECGGKMHIIPSTIKHIASQSAKVHLVPCITGDLRR